MKLKFIYPVFAILFVIACAAPLYKIAAIPESEEALGKQLFFDPILSANNKIACSNCHKPQFAFADTVAFSSGVDNKKTSRNTPSAMNVASRPYLFWDGRAATLEDQVLHPIANPVEMGMSIPELIEKLKKHKYYSAVFQKIYGSEPSAELLGKCIATYERTLETGGSPFDLFIGGDSSAISISAMRGRDLFLGKAHCFDCHFTPDFTADEFKNIGLFDGKSLNDSGRYHISKDKEDIGKFKVPGLRNVALTAPYMHNGMFRSLDEVVDYYNNPEAFVSHSFGRDSILSKPLGLSQQEKSDLVAFLKTLTSLTLVQP